MLQLGQSPDHDFDAPLGLLSDCHRRIERFLDVMIQVCVARAGDEPHADEREALRRATEYFRVAAPRHTQDEEESLFPRLRAAGDPRVADVLAEIERLEADHEAAAQKHAEVECLVTHWLDAGRLTSGAVAGLSRALQELKSLYQTHIAVEDERVLPLAADVLSREEIRSLGHEMARRRGLAGANAKSLG